MQHFIIVFFNLIVFLALSAATSQSVPSTRLNQTLCAEKCHGDCKTYISPLGCYNPGQLWPGDPQWGDTDILDVWIDELFINRTFFSSNNGSCLRGRDQDPLALPLRTCIGPWDKPRPWGCIEPMI